MTQQQIEQLHAGLQDAASAGWRSLEELVARLLKEREMLRDALEAILDDDCRLGQKLQDQVLAAIKYAEGSDE